MAFRKGKTRRRLMHNRFLLHQYQSQYAIPGPLDLIIVLDALKPNYNIGKIFRSAATFGCKEIYLIDIPFFDPYPAKGALRYVKTKFFKSHQEAFSLLNTMGYTSYLMDMKKGESLFSCSLPKKKCPCLRR